MEILIYKTNITSQKKAKQLSPIFNSFSEIKDWNIDTKDIDKVLRIETTKHLDENKLIQLVNSQGFYCGELL